MELVIILRRLWRIRYALVAGLLGAVVVVVGTGGYKLERERSSIAWTQVMLDTPRSQTVDADPDGAGSLNWRAQMLMHLLATDDVNADLARRLGVPAHEVVVVDSSVALPEVPASLPKRASDTAAVVGAPYVLTTRLADDALALITLEAVGPDQAEAKRLAAAAVEVLETRESPGGRFTSSIVSGGGGFMEKQRFVIDQVAPVRSKELTKPVVPAKTIAAAGAGFVLCFALALLAAKVLRPRPRLHAPSPAS